MSFLMSKGGQHDRWAFVLSNACYPCFRVLRSAPLTHDEERRRRPTRLARVRSAVLARTLASPADPL
jgi:hypothetical protein